MNRLTRFLTYPLVALVALSLSVPALTSAKDSDKNSHPSRPALEVRISERGKVLVRGAGVLSNSNGVITATTTWGAASLIWTVKTGTSTEFIHRNGLGSSLGDILPGHIISFTGVIDTEVSPLTVNADTVKDWSLRERRASFTGVIQSLNASSSTFTLLTEASTTISVEIASTTPLMKEGSAIVFAALSVNDKVKVSGIYNGDTKILKADKVTVYIDSDSDSHAGIRGKIRLWAERFHFNFRFDKDKDDDD